MDWLYKLLSTPNIGCINTLSLNFRLGSLLEVSSAFLKRIHQFKRTSGAIQELRNHGTYLLWKAVGNLNLRRLNDSKRAIRDALSLLI